MIRRLLPTPIAVACVTAAWPTIAAEEATAGGLSGSDFGSVILAVASALLITALFRTSATRLIRSMRQRIDRYRISRILKSRCTDVLTDFILPGAYGGLTRIDYAALTSKGIVCIQTRHCNGIVIGKANDPQWTNIDGVVRQKFLNPLIQNEGRSKAIRKIAAQLPVTNLVIFTGATKFPSAMENNVIRVGDLDKHLARFLIEADEIQQASGNWISIRAAALTDDESRKDFAAQLSFS